MPCVKVKVSAWHAPGVGLGLYVAPVSDGAVGAIAVYLD